MTKRNRLLDSIAGTIADYRAGEIAVPTPQHVERWIGQFSENVQNPMLSELDHVLKRTYIPKVIVQEFLSSLLKNEALAGSDSCSYWEGVKFLDIQGGGNSQREMLRTFGVSLQEEYGLVIDNCGNDPKVYLYLDDAIFTGNRVRSDISSWIQTEAPQQATVHIVTIALHLGGQWYAEGKIQDVAKAEGKRIHLKWWNCIEIEDRRTYIKKTDVLRPTSIPAHSLTQEYVSGLKYAPVLRPPGNVGENKFFSSEVGRHLLEQELLKAGTRIRSLCPNLNVYQRPLGNMLLETLGFGSMLVTFRNCANNCPLAFWAGDPWYPLFPRKTN